MPRDKLALEIGKKARAAAKDILAAVVAESQLSHAALLGPNRPDKYSMARQALALLLYRDTGMSYPALALWLEPYQQGERRIRRHVVSDGARRAKDRIDAGDARMIGFIGRVEARYERRDASQVAMAA